MYTTLLLPIFLVCSACASFQFSLKKKMHGRLKVRTSAEEAARKKKEQEIKVKAYRAGMTKIFEKRRNNEFDDEMLQISGQILSRNPDVYTLWNIRRESLLKLSEGLDNESKQTLYDRDIGFTEQCLMANPKSYGAWHHRCWVLENSPSPNWNKEVDVCNKYLKLDERNLHCWDYRRFVVSKAAIPSEKELEYCTEKIRNNFSNYSSWHYRSKLLPLLYPHESNTLRPINESKLKEELEMVLSAAFTDPNDSSAWFYQRWLLGYSQPALDFAAARISSTFATLAFTKPINIKSCKISTNFGFDLSPERWHSVGNDPYDCIWTMNGSFEFNSAIDSKFSLQCLMDDGVELNMDFVKCPDGFYGIKCPNFEYEFGTTVREELKNQLDSCNQLLEFEPDSKWTLLTASLLMRAIDRNVYYDKSLEYLRKLEKVDFLRRGYYADLASKWSIEKRLEEWIESGNLETPLDLSGLSLTAIFYEQFMSIADAVNLKSNFLLERSAAKFNAFQFCKDLNVSYNRLRTPAVIPHLSNLKILSLEGNKFCDSGINVDELNSRVEKL